MSAPGSVRTARYRARLRARLRDNPAAAADVPHGKRFAYTAWGCRCVACTEAEQAYQAGYQARRRQGRGLPPTPWQAQFLDRGAP